MDDNDYRLTDIEHRMMEARSAIRDATGIFVTDDDTQLAWLLRPDMDAIDALKVVVPFVELQALEIRRLKILLENKE